jgi:hypothetical protein
VQKVLAASLRGADYVRQVCRTERRVLMTESKALHQMRRLRAADPGAVFTIEVAIARIDAELQCVAAAESHATERLIVVTADGGTAEGSAAENTAAENTAAEDTAAEG